VVYDPTFHRLERLRAVERWSEVGVLERREQLPIERAFADRVARSSGVFFKPVSLRDSSSVEFHRQLSYLIDAFDALPERVDIAFDSTWKAFDSASSYQGSVNMTERLKLLAPSIDATVANRLSANFPVQSCEYLFKRLVSDVVASPTDDRVVRIMNRIAGLNDGKIVQLLSFLRTSYGDASADSRRKGTLLLRRALRGDVLQLGAVAGFGLDVRSRSRVLLSLYLYTARNDRFHGESFSPFVSSAASLRTYTHSYFSFLASYYLLLCVWLDRCPDVLSCDAAGLAGSLDANLKSAIELFGRHWEK
jgi:hypothetical protein